MLAYELFSKQLENLLGINAVEVIVTHTEHVPSNLSNIVRLRWVSGAEESG
jgi:hypothetical protein